MEYVKFRCSDHHFDRRKNDDQAGLDLFKDET